MSCKTILPRNIDEVINALDLVEGERIDDMREKLAKIEHFNDALKIDEEFLSLLVDEYEAGRFYDFEPGRGNLWALRSETIQSLGLSGL